MVGRFFISWVVRLGVFNTKTKIILQRTSALQEIDRFTRNLFDPPTCVAKSQDDADTDEEMQQD